MLVVTLLSQLMWIQSWQLQHSNALHMEVTGLSHMKQSSSDRLCEGLGSICLGLFCVQGGVGSYNGFCARGRVLLLDSWYVFTVWFILAWLLAWGEEPSTVMAFGGDRVFAVRGVFDESFMRSIPIWIWFRISWTRLWISWLWGSF